MTEAEKQFEERMNKKTEEEAREAAQDAERKRQDYLRRTGRTKMEP